MGISGSNVWGVQRLLLADAPEHGQALGVLLPALTMLAGGLAMTTVEVAELLLVAARYCLI